MFDIECNAILVATVAHLAALRESNQYIELAQLQFVHNSTNAVLQKFLIEIDKDSKFQFC